MRLITKDTDYAMRALVYIAKNRTATISVREITSELDLSLPFLRKILQILNANHILLSVKGKGGGFQLAKPPDEIFLKDLIRIFQGDLTLRHCKVQSEICPNLKTCLLHIKLLEAEKRLKSEIADLSIQELCTYSEKQSEAS